MLVFKCRICGDPYAGGAKPSHCPFCGAPDRYIIPAKDWTETEQSELSDVSKANLEHALMLETNNVLFYSCSDEVAMSAELGALFNALTKIEAEHASVIRKLLSLPEPAEEEDNRGRCHALESMNVTEAHDREKRAIDFYIQAAEAAPERRVKEIFTALAEIETTHVKLLGSLVNALGVQSVQVI